MARLKVPVVFTSELLSKLKRKYDRLAPHQRSRLVSIAINDSFELFRSFIEGWVSFLNLDENSLRKLVSKLQDENLFMGTLNELAVGIYLKSRYPRVFYEFEMDELTPDWYVEIDESRSFVVEVFYNDDSLEEKKLRKVQEDLQARLQKLPHKALLSVHFKNHRKQLSSKECKELVHVVKKWLDKNPEPKSVFELIGIEFELYSYGDYDNLLVAGNYGGGFVDEKPIKDSFIEKIKKYAPLLEKKSLPMAVALTHNWESQKLYPFESVYSAIMGSQQMVTYVNRSTGDVVGAGMGRAQDGVLALEKSVFASAFMHVMQNELTDWSIRTIYNQAAKYQLPICFLGDKIDEVKKSDDVERSN